MTFFQFIELQTLFVTPQLCLSEETVNSVRIRTWSYSFPLPPPIRPRAVDYTHFFPLLYFSHPPIFPHSFPSSLTYFLFLFSLPPSLSFPFFYSSYSSLSLMSFPLLPFYLKTLIGFYALYYDLWNPYYLPLLNLQIYKRDSHAHRKVQHYLKSSLWK